MTWSVAIDGRIRAKGFVYLCQIQEKILRSFGATCACLPFVQLSRVWAALVRLCTVWQFKGRMKNGQDSWQIYLCMCQCWYGWTKVGVMTNYRRKYGYSMRGISPCDHRLLIRGTRYTTIPVEGVDDVYIAQGNVNGDRFSKFILMPLMAAIHGLLLSLVAWIQ